MDIILIYQEGEYMQQLEVKAGNDRLERISKNISALSAIEELIWNALDADAYNISVNLKTNSLGEIDEITVVDDGEGMSYKEATHAFGNHGASKKQSKPRTQKGRLFHGRNGEGRYKALRLGNCAEWESVYYDNKDKILKKFKTSIYASTRTLPNIDDSPVETEGHTGTKVKISHIDGCSNLLNDDCLDKLGIRFAPYLMGYKDINISYNTQKINPESNLTTSPVTMPIIIIDKNIEYKAELLLCQWKGKDRTFHLCSEEGVILHDVDCRICPDFSYSAYLKSNYFSELNSEDKLGINDCYPEVVKLKDKAFDEIKAYFKQQTEENAAELVRDLKKQDIYPYKKEPQNIIEETEQKVFDICALKIHEHIPDFSKTEKKQKEFTLTLLKHALETEPSSMKTILQTILNLSDEEKDELADILEYTTLSALTKTARCITNRLCFLNGLEQIVADKEVNKYLKERAHLQHIIESEYWIFGEQYNFMSPKGGDITLANVLKAHLSILGRDELSVSISPNELTDIPDICLYQQYFLGKPDEYENLVIELKRPGNLTEDNIMQIKKYANAVADDNRFDKSKIKWTFFLINTGFNKTVKSETNQKGRDKGLIYEPEDSNIKVWCKTWGEIIQECKGRIEFVRNQMEISLESNQEGIRYLRDKYTEYLPELIIGEKISA